MDPLLKLDAPPPAEVAVGPVSVRTWTHRAVLPDGRVKLLLLVDTPIGRAVYYLDPDHARSLATQLQELAAR